MTKYITVCYRPLTTVSPAFYGSGVALVGYSYPFSRPIPTIYTVAGAALNLLSNVTGYSYDALESLVLNDKLKIYGVYIKALMGNKELSLVPVFAFYYRGRLQPIQLLTPSSTEVYMPLTKPVKKPVNAKLVLALAKLTAEGADISSLYHLEVDTVYRVGILIDEKTRTVQRQGALYSYTAIANYTICGDGGCTNKISFCVDLEIEHGDLETKIMDVADKTNVVAQDLGGEQSVSKPELRLCREAPRLVVLSKKGSGLQLAVSHIALDERGGEGIDIEYTTLRGEKVEAYIGRIELLTGWLIRDNTPKPPQLTLAPGTLYWSSKTGVAPPTPKGWWQKLLATAIPLKE